MGFGYAQSTVYVEQNVNRVNCIFTDTYEHTHTHTHFNYQLLLLNGIVTIKIHL